VRLHRRRQSSGTSNGAVVTDNWVSGKPQRRPVGRIPTTAVFEIADNYISGNYSNGLIYEISYNAQISGNTFVKNGIGSGPGKSAVSRRGAIYVSESGGGRQGCRASTAGSLTITHNTFVNNWSGVILWENANRFLQFGGQHERRVLHPRRPPARSPWNRAMPRNIDKQPYIDDCRWEDAETCPVDHNVFDFNAAAVSRSCSAATGCGFQGVFSEYGTFPKWSPYQKHAR